MRRALQSTAAMAMRERQRRLEAEEGGAGEGADRADRDGPAVELQRESLPAGHERDHGQQSDQVLRAAVGEAEDAGHEAAQADRDDEREERRGQRHEAGPCGGMWPLLRLLFPGPHGLDGRHVDLEQLRPSVARLVGHGREPRLAVRREQHRLRAGGEHAVAALELRAVHGEVGLVDDLVGVGAVVGIDGDADGDGRADRLARGLHLEALLGDRAPDALGDVEGLLRRRLRQEDGELLTAEARRDVRVAQMAAEDVGDALQDGVACEMPVRVVDVAEEVEVGHDHRQGRAGPLRARELLAQRAGEVAGVEEPRLGVDTRLLLERRDAQRAVDQQQRCDGRREQERIRVPERGERHAQHGEDEVRREALDREETGAAQRVPAREVQHRCEQEVVRSRRRRPRRRGRRARTRAPARGRRCAPARPPPTPPGRSACGWRC